MTNLEAFLGTCGTIFAVYGVAFGLMGYSTESRQTGLYFAAIGFLMLLVLTFL